MSEEAHTNGPSADELGGFLATLGITEMKVDDGRVTLRLPIKAHLHQPYGIVHGGVWCSLVETAASMAAALWLGDKGQVVGVSNHTDFLRAIREGEVVAVASPIHCGRSQQLWLVEITDVSTSKMVARGEVRLQNMYEAVR